MESEEKLWSKDKIGGYFQTYDFFQLNNKRYVDLLEQHFNLLKDSNLILDTGCGTGNLTLKLLQNNKSVSAIDINEEALDYLKLKCNSYLRNLEVHNHSLENLDTFKNGKKNIFDGANSMIVLPFVKDVSNYVSNVYRLLKPNGKFVLTAWANTEDIRYGVIDVFEQELKQKGILEKYLKEWQEQIKYSSSFTEQIKSANLSKEKLDSILLTSGFSKIKTVENSYGKYAHTLIAQK